MKDRKNEIAMAFGSPTMSGSPRRVLVGVCPPHVDQREDPRRDRHEGAEQNRQAEARRDQASEEGLVERDEQNESGIEHANRRKMVMATRQCARARASVVVCRSVSRANALPVGLPLWERAAGESA